MNIKINSIHFNADQKLENFINEKIIKLNNFGEEIINTDITLSLERASGKNYDSKVVKIKLRSKNHEYFAEKKSEKFEMATDEAISALRNQIIKRKEKVMKKK